MNPKPYKENKSSLQDFLERKNLRPLPKKARGKIAKKVPTNRWYIALHDTWIKGSEEDKERLKAIGWEKSRAPHKEWDKTYARKLKEMKENDEWNSTIGNSRFWIMLGRSYGKTSTPIQTEGYYVAGKCYRDRADFLFSLTGLGKELL